ncbi:MAG: DUF3426 domain-containing protein [Pseudoxanthomonas sp.]|nr:DUF3426 domain-containing protein [Pseudoxanthomonas sp.]MBP8804725.1 DUF3426 domain-containing protein [Pseudoxanthomonas sp.]MBP9645241.1 DUF3426 domain-containing protein [Pseudoxanthomonas sp.]
MFFPCPYCQFLVNHHPQLRPLPHACPRCGRPLIEDGVSLVDLESSVPDAPDAEAASVAPAAPAASGSLATLLIDPPVAAPVSIEADPTAEENEEAATVEPVEAPPASEPEPAPAAATTASTGPAFAAPTAAGRGRWRWPLIALLALLLGLQILLADRARLAADPGWRPVVENLCGALGCTLPAWHEPTAFLMLDRQIRPADTPGALRVDATFRNDARWAQDWPALQLALSDADGRVLGSAVFTPEQYLGAAPATRLAPGQSAQASFLVREPAPGTVAFSFEFR